MTLSDFIAFFSLSRDALNRKIRSARQSGGIFQIPGRGWYRATKTGTAATSPLDIVPVPPPHAEEEDSELSADTDPFANLLRLPQDELDRRKTIADIQKVRSQTAEGRAEIEAELIADISPTVLAYLRPLRLYLEGLDLSADQVADLNARMSEVTQNLKYELKKQHKETL